jgi:hypothetical protein
MLGIVSHHRTDARVRVKVDMYSGIPHGFTLFAQLPASDIALQKSAEAVSWILSTD